jgi:pyruvate formate lyase activating enzyme
MKEAMYYEKSDSGTVKCRLCPNNCTIKDGGYGICRVRKNEGGKLAALTYGMVSSIALDPIEKKPLDYFMPGTYILSVGTFGCNFRCGFCQNWTISQEKPELKYISPKDLAETAAGIISNIGIAFTYNEPSIWYEYILETCKLNRKNNLANVLVTNGYINAEPLDELLPHIDAMNIDIKSFNNDYYKKVCGGKLAPVKDTIRKSAAMCHVELTNLSVPGLNDSTDEMDEMCRWIASIDKDIPLHLIPLRPLYKMSNHPGQTFNKLSKLRETALKHLTRVSF